MSEPDSAPPDLPLKRSPSPTDSPNKRPRLDNTSLPPVPTGNVPTSPRAREHFFTVHGQLAALGAAPLAGIEQLKEEIREGEEREMRELKATLRGCVVSSVPTDRY
jgi:hypothetical protein